ncbi:AAA family ATPase [Chondromyces apiculatus]|uniref:TonB-dependent receptor n=1 Tax=Chondromyces apiculatus DSM 436 TaxID=1192034 RepID=A0A017ST40_9BACT|nr:AAA family ATPase [Chondromyces apiculatus]EYF00114.1 TonB-dependent receptor [Chondromyces apiculatus DSM 436]
MVERDALLDVFLSNTKKEIFHSIEHRHQIWRENPFDVESVHKEAREEFQHLLTQATTPPGLEAGRILLLLGESGSGKTHLVRAFRNHVHRDGLGFVGYMHMTTAVSYPRYLLNNLIDSLDQPYYEPLGTKSGLHHLSSAVAARCGNGQAIADLQDREDLSQDDVVSLVEQAADSLFAQPRYEDLDLDLVRALLYLQRQNSTLKKRVVKYLRCEELSPQDRKVLGEITSKRVDEDAQKLVEHLGRLMWALDSRALVLCVDQFEDAYQSDQAETLFRRAMASLCSVADQVPSSVIVIACLEDYYEALRNRLTRSTLDRLENDPAPVHLRSARTAKEVEMIIRQRLGHLYETSGLRLPNGATDTIYPIPPRLVRQLVGMRARSVLDECRNYRDECIEAGQVVEPPGDSSPRPTPPPPPEERSAKESKEKLEQEWNDFLAENQEEPPEDEEEFAELFGWAIEACADELETGCRFKVKVEGRMIEVRIEVPVAGGGFRPVEEIVVAVCNRAPQGGGLRVQLEETVAVAGKKRIPAMIRCIEFPSNPKTQVVQVLGGILKAGGRKAVVEDSDWRTIAAFRKFRDKSERRAQFLAWLMEENHLSRLRPLIDVLDLDRLERFEEPAPRPAPATRPPTVERAVQRDAPVISMFQEPDTMLSGVSPFRAKQAPGSPESPPRVEAGAITLGVSGEIVSHPVEIDPAVLTAHAAFLGSTGSGKTTLALNVIEQLLLQGVPAVLVDRKGDLCAYAREAPWNQVHPDPVLEARRRALRERLDVAVFTPGHPEGRQLALSLMPKGVGKLKDLERDQAAKYAAEALGDMLGYKQTRKDKSLRAILVQAFQIYAEHGSADQLDLETLIGFIDEEDPTLVAALGRLDTRLLINLVQDLEVFKLGSEELLSSDGDKLDAELLLGLGAHARPGKTRLSIISTKFLGDNAKILFWVSQLLLTLTRWVTRAPSPRLQAVAMFDEADVYLPAQSQPATKGPMENLLRRARSGGLGMLLATQSPGDLDYKCRDNIRSWFVGRVAQNVALEKMKPLFAEARVNVAGKIPGQSTGEFHLLQDGKVTAFKAHQALLRTEQVPEHEVLRLAASRKQAAGGAGGSGPGGERAGTTPTSSRRRADPKAR